MDRMVHTALNSLKMLMQNQQITAQNISNASVIGYRKDAASDFSSIYLKSEDGLLDSRVFSTRQIGGFSEKQGDLESTENPLDIAIRGNGYLIVQPLVGDIALSRRGDLKINPEGQLMDGEGSLVLGQDLQPIIVPPYRDLSISSDGTISIKALDAGVDALAEDIGVIGTIASDDLELEKSVDGFIRPKATLDEGGNLVEPIPIESNQEGFIVNKFLENSNVNAVEELIQTLEQQRHYETHVKFIDLAKQLDEAGTSLMRMPE